MVGSFSSLEEIVSVIDSLNNDRSFGVDGLLIEFYKANKDCVAKDLFDVYREHLQVGSLGQDINKGIMKIFPKDRDRSLI